MRYRIHENPPTYDQPYYHTQWAEHVQRMRWTVEEVEAWMSTDHFVGNIIDLSCGDAALALALQHKHEVDALTLGDMVDATLCGLDVVGPIENTIKQYTSVEAYDLFILTETLEHLDDPDAVLRDIRKVARTLLVTTPINESLTSDNEQHLWSWDTVDVGKMLSDAGFTITERMATLACDYYTYQLWIVS